MGTEGYPYNKGTMAMETDENEGTDKPKTIETVKIEWNWDFDNLWHEMKGIRGADQEYKLGKEGRFGLKGRCRRCWGGLIGKGAAEHVPTAICCRVCGILLEGDDAREEYRRMSEQSASNTFNIVFGFPPGIATTQSSSKRSFRISIDNPGPNCGNVSTL